MLQNATRKLPFAAPFLAITVLSIILFFPTWLALLSLWLQWDQVLAHGLAAFALFIALTVVHPPRGPSTEQRANQPVPGGGSWLGAVAFALAVIGWLLFSLVNISTLTFLMLPALLATFCWAALGFQAGIRWLPYLALLSLSLPFWSDLTGPLVVIASHVVGGLVGQLGMPALIEGNSITLPYGRLLIADGCSGIRYFAISILLASCIAILNDYRLKGWVVIVAVAMLLGMIANWVRILGLVIIAYQSEMQSDLLTDHEFYGWLIYGAVVLPALYFSPIRRRSLSFRNHAYPITRNSLLRAGLIALLGLGVYSFYQGSINPQPQLTITGDGYNEASFRQPAMPLNIPASLQQTTYWHTPTRTWVGLASFQRQSSREKLVPYLPGPIDTDTWRELSQQTTDRGYNLVEHQNRMSQRKALQILWYRVGPYQTDKYWMAKLLQIPATLQGDNRFAQVTMQRACSSLSCDTEREQLLRAAAALTLAVP